MLCETPFARSHLEMNVHSELAVRLQSALVFPCER
jgi:hypothetical protein